MGLWPAYFLIVTTLFFGPGKYSVHTANVLGNDNNVGSVLFDRSSLSSHCWTSEELVMLGSRKNFQDLLPKVETLNIQNDQYIAELLNYFQICLEHVRKRSVGKTKHLMLNSLADTMGGYLHSYVLPITKVSFYAGTVKFHNVEKTFQVFAELKDFLHTDGTGWTNPLKMEMFINVTPIAVPFEDSSAACRRLIYNPAISQKRSVLRKRRLARLKRKRFAARFHNVTGENDDEYNSKSVDVFLPFLDDELKPNSIALPFKDHNLWSLHDEKSVAILSRYYETSVNCLSSKENYQQILMNFNRDFYKWLLQHVYPRLNDDKWYPAFGGVLRIIIFLKDSLPDDKSNSIFTPTLTTTLKPIDVTTTMNVPSEGSRRLMIIGMSSAAVLALLIGLSLLCCRYLRKHSDECSPSDSPRSDVALLYRNRDFGDLDTCPSNASRKTIRAKVKDWWKGKFKTCPGGCDRILETERYIATLDCKSKDSLISNRSTRSYKRRKKKVRSISVTASPSSSPCGLENKRFFYSTDISSSESESSYR